MGKITDCQVNYGGAEIPLLTWECKDSHVRSGITHISSDVWKSLPIGDVSPIKISWCSCIIIHAIPQFTNSMAMVSAPLTLCNLMGVLLVFY